MELPQGFEAYACVPQTLNHECALLKVWEHHVAIPHLRACRLGKFKRGAMLINVSRGGLVDTDAVFGALRTGQLGSVGLDVYEGEGVL